MRKKKQVIKKEIAKKTLRDRVIYHYVDTERGINCKSKEVFKRQDRIILYPFYFDRDTRQVKPRYRKIRTFTFEGLDSRVPSGFIQYAARGYGATRYLRPIIRFVESNFELHDITISRKKNTQFTKGSLIINFKDFDSLRKQVNSVIRLFSEKNKTLVNNYFAMTFPRKFENRREKYQRGTIHRIAKEYDAVEQNLSVDDKNVLLKLFEKLSLTRKNFFERQELISTKQKIERKFIEDVLKKFEKLLAQKKGSEDTWQNFFVDNAWIFSQLFAYPTVLIKDKAYVGGKTIADSEGKIIDFLYQNKLTKNSALIEIKKHTTPLLNKKPYRGSDVFSMGKEFSGAISQILDQRETYCKKFDSLRGEDDINSFNPKCIVLIGRISSLNKKQFKAFELMRSSLKDVEIFTFDELYERIKSILSIFTKEENEAKKKV